MALGLSQANLALFLGIARMQYARAENGLMSLPEKALPKMIALEIALKEVIAENKGLPMSFNILKKRNRKKRRYLLLVMQQQLERMKADYERFGLWYLTLVKIQLAGQGDNRWIEAEKQNAANKLARCNLAQQQDLAEKIYLLQSEEKFLNQYRMKNQIQPMNNNFITIKTQSKTINHN